MKPTELFTRENCIRDMYDDAPNDSNSGCIAIIKPEALVEAYRTPANQLFRVESGFGASPSKMGNAVYGTFCADGEQTRWERYNFIGIADEETTRYAEELMTEWSPCDFIELNVVSAEYPLVLSYNTGYFTNDRVSVSKAVQIFLGHLSDTSYCEDSADLEVNRIVREKLSNGDYTFVKAYEAFSDKIVVQLD